MRALRLVFMGTPDFAATCLKYLVANDAKVLAVYTGQDRAAGRGRVLAQSAVKRTAMEMGLPVFQPRNFRSEATVAALTAMKPEVAVVAAYGQILPQPVLDISPHGFLNVHPSLLPKYRGVSPVTASILAGDEFAGVSVMLLDAGTDTGPILAQAQVPVSAEDTAGSLSAKLARIGAQLVVDVLPRWVRGGMKARPQEQSKVSYSRKLSKEDGLIDWRLTAVQIWRNVRAFNPWPGAFTVWRGRQLKMLAARPVATSGPACPGQVVALQDGEMGFAVGTGDGLLGVVTVQLQGKRAMPAGDFLRGQRELLGEVLG